MIDFLFPLSARVSAITPKLVSNSAAERSIFTGATRSMSRAGDHFGFDLTVTSASDHEISGYAVRAALRAVSSRVRGAVNRIWFADPSYGARGSFPQLEAVVNGLFANGASGWSTNQASIVVADRVARVQNSTTAAGYIVSAAAMTLTASAAYVVRAALAPGNKSAWQVKVGTTSGASDLLASGALTSAGLYIGSFTAGGGGVGYVSLLCNTTTAADFVHYPYVSVTRCLLVNGATQTGTDLAVKGAPASTNGLLLPGDRVQLGTQLNVVSMPFNSDGSGDGYLQCDLPWRASPNDGAPIIVATPMGRMVTVLSTSAPVSLPWNENPGGLADFSFSFEEALDT